MLTSALLLQRLIVPSLYPAMPPEKCLPLTLPAERQLLITPRFSPTTPPTETRPSTVPVKLQPDSVPRLVPTIPPTLLRLPSGMTVPDTFRSRMRPSCSR